MKGRGRQPSRRGAGPGAGKGHPPPDEPTQGPSPRPVAGFRDLPGGTRLRQISPNDLREAGNRRAHQRPVSLRQDRVLREGDGSAAVSPVSCDRGRIPGRAGGGKAYGRGDRERIPGQREADRQHRPGSVDGRERRPGHGKELFPPDLPARRGLRGSDPGLRKGGVPAAAVDVPRLRVGGDPRLPRGVAPGIPGREKTGRGRRFVDVDEHDRVRKGRPSRRGGVGDGGGPVRQPPVPGHSRPVPREIYLVGNARTVAGAGDAEKGKGGRVPRRQGVWQGGNYRAREPPASVLVSRGGETGAGGVLARDGPLVPGPDRNSRPLRVRPGGKRPGGGALDARGGRGPGRPGHARRGGTGGGGGGARSGAAPAGGGDPDRPAGYLRGVRPAPFPPRGDGGSAEGRRRGGGEAV